MDASPPARRQMFPTVSAPRLRRLSEVRDEVRDTQSEVRDTHAPDQFMGVLGLSSAYRLIGLSRRAAEVATLARKINANR